MLRTVGHLQSVECVPEYTISVAYILAVRYQASYGLWYLLVMPREILCAVTRFVFVASSASYLLTSRHHPQISLATVVVTYWILISLLGIVVFAHPSLRSKSHNKFERTHRFLGWGSTILVWGQVCTCSSPALVLAYNVSSSLSS